MPPAGKVDYIVPTWNSAKTLDSSLASIVAHGNPDRIIIVDNESTDGTLDIAERHGCVILKDTASLGSARRTGLLEARTEWIGFVDSDVVLCRDWFSRLLKFMDDRTGGIHGDKLPDWEPYRSAHRATMKGAFADGPLRKGAGDRGFTDNTLVLREVALKADIESVNAFEDMLITQAVVAEGLEWLHVPVFVDHHESWETFIRKPGWHSAGLKWLLSRGDISTGRFMRELLLRNSAWYVLDGVKKTMEFHEGKLLRMRLAQLYYLWIGLVRSETMFQLER